MGDKRKRGKAKNNGLQPASGKRNTEPARGNKGENGKSSGENYSIIDPGRRTNRSVRELAEENNTEFLLIINENMN